MPFRPMHDRVLVRRVDDPNCGGIIIPDPAQKNHHKALSSLSELVSEPKTVNYTLM